MHPPLVFPLRDWGSAGTCGRIGETLQNGACRAKETKQEAAFGLRGNSMGIRSLIAALLCILMGTTASLAAQNDPAAKTTITLARVSDDPAKNLPRLQAMADYLAQRLSHLGIREGRAVIAKTNQEMLRLLRTGTVDVMSETVISALYFEQNGGAELLLHEWKKGVAYYKSLLVVNRNSGIETLDDLVGHTVAFEDPGSTSGFLIPFALLREHELSMQQLTTPRQKPTPGQVGYIFTHSEINIAASLARGLLGAGAISDKDLNDERRVPSSVRQLLVTLVESPPILRSVLLVNGRMEESLKQEIQQALLDAPGDEDGKAALKAYYKVKQYTKFEGDALANLNRMRQLYTRLNGIF